MSVVESIVTAVIDQLTRANRVVVAVSGPQGSGKTTASKEAALQLSEKHKIPTVAISLDDFYKPYLELQAIAKHGNPLLKHRGLPGTHDVALLSKFLKEFKTGSDNLEVPAFDKGLHNGAGDRSGFVSVPSSTVAILLEGWMVGFKPIGAENVKRMAKGAGDQNWSVNPTTEDLLEIESNLQDYVEVWNQFNEFVRLVPSQIDYIYKWRLQQEHELREKRGTGMSDTEVKNFVDQYMPCYYLYNETLPKPSESIAFTLNEDHSSKRSKY